MINHWSRRKGEDDIMYNVEGRTMDWRNLLPSWVLEKQVQHLSHFGFDWIWISDAALFIAHFHSTPVLLLVVYNNKWWWIIILMNWISRWWWWWYIAVVDGTGGLFVCNWWRWDGIACLLYCLCCNRMCREQVDRFRLFFCYLQWS
jgi:hypothetical protein